MSGKYLQFILKRGRKVFGEVFICMSEKIRIVGGTESNDHFLEQEGGPCTFFTCSWKCIIILVSRVGGNSLRLASLGTDRIEMRSSITNHIVVLLFSLKNRCGFRHFLVVTYQSWYSWIKHDCITTQIFSTVVAVAATQNDACDFESLMRDRQRDSPESCNFLCQTNPID